MLHHDTTLPLPDDVAIAEAASLVDADSATAELNAASFAQVTRLGEPVVLSLIGVSRDPEAYHELMKTCSALQPCREGLDAAGKSFELPDGGYAFILPDHYAPAMTALDLFDLAKEIKPHHVLVSQEYKEIVLKEIRSLRCRLKVRRKSNRQVPANLLAEAHASDIEVRVTNTFLHFEMPTSSNSSNGHYVVSTTDAHGGRNPRRKCGYVKSS